jgi:hypothetical protein
MVYTASKTNSLPVPTEPGVLSIRATRTTAELNMPVFVPWKNCKLVYAYAITSTVVATADLELDLELNAASGTEIMTITVPTASSAVGDITEATFTDATAGENLDRDDTARDAVNIEIGAHASGAGAADVFMYFEIDS